MYGGRNRQYLLDVFKADARGNPVEFQKFSRWLSQAMTEAIFLHSICLDPDPYYCPTSKIDPVSQKTLSDMSAAFNETADNLRAVEACCPCRSVQIIEVFPYNDALRDRECTGGAKTNSCTDEKKVEVELKFDNEVVFPRQKISEEMWVGVTTTSRHYYQGGPEAGFKLEWSEEDAEYLIKRKQMDGGSVQVSREAWYEADKCEAYDKVFVSNEGDETGLWKFKVRVEQSAKC
jgi:hypothetical protein